MTVVRRALAPGEPDHEAIWVGVGLALVLVGALVQVGWAPLLVCPLKLATGWPCVGCGATRALAALSHGAVGAALRANPLATLVAFGWAAWALQAVAVLASGARRVRLTFSRRDVVAARWAACLATAAGWLFLVADAR